MSEEKRLYGDGSRVERGEFGKWLAFYPDGRRHIYRFDSAYEAEAEMVEKGWCKGGWVKNGRMHPDKFYELLLSCGFDSHGHWLVKQSSSVGPVVNLRIAPYFGCDGCIIQQSSLGGGSNEIEIRMPETEQEFRDLCRVLGVELYPGDLGTVRTSGRCEACKVACRDA